MAVYFCDTDCELWHTTVKELGIGVIQMPYTIDGEEYLYDFGEKTDLVGFFKKMEAGSVASTSAQNEAYYLNIFEPYFAKGEDILYVSFSTKMSSTFNFLDSAIETLKAKYPGIRFERFDTESICIGCGIQVELGARFFNSHNHDIDATIEYLTKVREHTDMLFVVENLKYLARGGRLSPAKAAIGNFMQVKPILSTKDGELNVVAKQNGSKKAMSYVVEQFASKYQDLDDAPVYVLGADCDDVVEELTVKIKAYCPKANIINLSIGPVIGAHCGPKTYGVIYTKK